MLGARYFPWLQAVISVFQPENSAGVPKWPPTTHFWGPDFSRKGQYSAMFLICKRGSVVSRPLMVNQVNMLADSKRFID